MCTATFDKFHTYAFHQNFPDKNSQSHKILLVTERKFLIYCYKKKNQITSNIHRLHITLGKKKGTSFRVSS